MEWILPRRYWAVAGAVPAGTQTRGKYFPTMTPFPLLRILIVGLLAAAGLASASGQTAIPGNPVATARTGSHTTYNVGPGQPYTEPDTVPWGALQAGDVVNVFYRATPYRWKIGLRGQGTQTAPIIVNGVTDAAGNRPVFDFNGARTASGSNPGGSKNVFTGDPQWGESLGGIVVKRGPSDAYGSYSPQWIELRNLELHGATNGNSYTTLAGGTATYNGGAGVWLQLGDDVLLENLVIYDNAFGIFTMAKDGLLSETCRRVTVRGCRVFGNGVVGSYYEHNFYVQCHLPVIEGNYIGRVRAGSEGSSYKSRSSGEIFRYNYVEASSRAIDWVHSEEQDTDGIVTQPEYGTDFAYGNVILNDATAASFASSPIHYGGDNLGEQSPGDPVLVPATAYRSHLYFWNNTVVFRGNQSQQWRQNVFALSLVTTTAEAWNNIIVVDAGGATPPDTSWVQYAGHLNLRGNNLAFGAPVSAAAAGANAAHFQVQQSGSLLTTDPRFVNLPTGDFHLLAASPAVNAGGAVLPAAIQTVATAHPVQLQPHLAANGADLRSPLGAAIDLGAFEYFAPPTTGYWAWIAPFALTSGRDAPLADPDGDGISNLLEYYLGLQPVAPSTTGITCLMVNSGGIDYPAIRFARRISATDVTMQVEVATDPSFGALLGSTQVSVTPGPNSTEIVTVRSTTPVGAAARQFLRLHCTLP